MKTVQRLLCALPLMLASMFLQSAETAMLTEGQRNELLSSATRIRYERKEGKAMVVGHGTAFGIDLGAYGKPGRRYLLSAAHNVLDKSGNPYPTLKIEIPRQNGQISTSRCKMISADTGLDVCLLECEEDLPVVVTLAESDERIKAPVILAGSPRGIPVQLYDGMLVRRYYEGTVHSLAELEFDHGCSGGPVFSTRTGKVIGIAVAGIPLRDDMDHTKGLFVPVSAIESFIAPLSQDVRSARTPQPLILANSQSIPSVDARAEIVELSEPLPEPRYLGTKDTNSASRAIIIEPEYNIEAPTPYRGITIEVIE
jgi:hypothetical protein